MYYTKEQTSRFKEQTFAHLEVTDKGRVLEIRLNRPQKKNAMTPTMVHELAFALAYAKEHRPIRAVVLSAEGTVFCSGADLKAFMGATEEHNSSIPEPSEMVLLGELFNTLYKPCIAKVEGPAYAGAFLLLCGCTHVVSVDDAVFGLPEVKRGLWPMQVMAGLLKVISGRKVLDWCMRGYKMEAKEAFDCGLVTQLAEKETIEGKVEALVEEICANSPTAIRLGLEAYHHIQAVDTKQQHEYLQQMLFQCLSSNDAREGLKAFKEKRKPNFE